jgi:hypothetical protein
MTQIISGHFDGKVIIPEQPVQVPVGQRLRVTLEIAANQEPPYADLLKLAADLPDAPTDLAHQHDHYLYGSPKK